MMRLPAGCARILCGGSIVTGVGIFLEVYRRGEFLSGLGILWLALGMWGLYVTRERNA